jgi:RNA polymerase sigma-70 factor (ECF subfamily)
MQQADASPATDDTQRWEARNRQLRQLIARAAGGEVAAFEALYEATAGSLLGIVRRLVVDGQAEDILAEAYVQIWRSLQAYDPGRSAPMVWMAVIARSRALDHLRRERSREAMRQRTGAGEAAATVEGPEHLLSQAQQARLVRLSVMNLDSTERLLVGLAYFRDCSYPEMARLTGLPVQSVRSCMASAQQKMRAQFLQPPVRAVVAAAQQRGVA